MKEDRSTNMLQLVLELIYNHPIIFGCEHKLSTRWMNVWWNKTEISCSVYFCIRERLLTAACVSALQVVSESTQHQQDIM